MFGTATKYDGQKVVAYDIVSGSTEAFAVRHFDTA
jgi:hypothetical protein